MDGCVVCGQPHYLTVDERSFCELHAPEVLLALEECVERLRRSRQYASTQRFATVADYTDTRLRATLYGYEIQNR